MKILLLFAPLCLLAQKAPDLEISTGSLKAKLYSPQSGYYQGTRFDWSGQVASLEYKGHHYFGKWFDKYDPKIHDAILGPVEEFQTDGKGLGYDEAKTGESFVRIGVGAVKKPEEKDYRQFRTYEIVDPGKWTVKRSKDRVEFTHELTDTNGYAYLYKKTLRLDSKSPRMAIEHSLKNTGKKAIVSTVYEHNFYMLNQQPSGLGVTVKFPFAVSSDRDLKGFAEPRGKELVYAKDLKKGESIYTWLNGYGNTAKDYDIRVEHTKAGIGVRQSSDRPMSKLVFWSIATTVCPEAYIAMDIAPGKTFTWKINYDFYELPSGAL
ncbi:hypothetical protein [Bryobacter aggregatus]|uniref:hypothetical protein n=1 Tax=Bryobacter aggregatus TaxID=360054 RepID=UPI0004E15AB6|nr:hypothetical protein [Bryobacter aggregatus]